MTAAALHVQLESELPDAVAVGAGTALFVCGWCFCPQDEIAALSLVLGGREQPVAAYGMPRLDPFRALHPGLDPFASTGLERDPDSPEDPELRSYRSGFWGMVRIEPSDRGPYRLALRAELARAGEATAELGEIASAEAATPLNASWPPDAEGARVAIAMATYNAHPGLLERQLESIRAQTHRNWVCVISDDASDQRSFAGLHDAIADDPRFLLSRSERRLGFYGNFERALSLVPAEAEYVALADQDDRWYPDKLTRLLDAIGGARLVYSDARVVDERGELISDTWWSVRANNHSDLLSVLVANSVTGAASLLPRELLDFALPFPPAQFAHFHDHWLGLVALSLGEIAYVPEPLYDYVQHGGASLGHAQANRMISLRRRFVERRQLRERVGMWRLHYFVDVWRLRQFATILLMRCGPRMDRGKRRTLERFLAGDRTVRPLITLALRGLKELVGPTTETLGAEWMLAYALAWRRLLAATARARPQRRLRLDALPPASLIQPPGRAGLDPAVAQLASKIEPLRWRVAEHAPRRVNLLIPTIDLQHFFGGYIGKFNLARRLADLGLKVRIVTVDPVGALAPDWKRRVESFAGLEGLLDAVEVAFGRESAGLECSRDDGFIATTWWTAHIAHAAIEGLRAERFVYLIQEYEPFTFPMGTYAALAAESYNLSHYAVFSSELLRGYFRTHRIGVFARGEDAGSVAFENAIRRVEPASADELRSRSPRRLLFYARPESHAARNMFELGVLGLARALAEGVFEGPWELNGIGSVGGSGEIGLGARATLRMLPRADPDAYASTLREHDVGLALMYTPHPSLVPIEMAAAGALTVTNTFENKTAEALSAISPNLIAVTPTVAGVATGLRAAVARLDDVEARVRGARVNWSRDWQSSFPDELLGRVLGAMGLPI